MRTFRTLSLVTTAIMAVSLVAAFLTGDFATEGSQLLDLAWGRMSLIDLYVGAVLIGAWMAHREESRLRIVAWWIALLVFGHLASAIYVFVAARSSDWHTFWSGSNPSSASSEAR